MKKLILSIFFTLNILSPQLVYGMDSSLDPTSYCTPSFEYLKLGKIALFGCIIPIIYFKVIPHYDIPEKLLATAGLLFSINKTLEGMSELNECVFANV